MQQSHKKKVAHLTQSLGCGGLESVIVNLVNASKEMEHIIISLTDDLEIQNRLPSHVKVVSLHKKEGKDFPCHLRLYKLLKTLSPDVLQTYNFPTIEYHWVAKLAGVKKCIHAEHGFGGEHAEGKDRLKNLFRKITSFLWSDYIVVSDDLKSWAINTVKIKPSLINVFYNGVPVPECQPDYPFKLFSPDNPLKLLTVGRLVDVKNQTQLVEAIGILQKNEPDKCITLDIVGEGDMRKDIEDAISKIPIPSSVILHGMQDDIPKFLQESDVFALSSIYEAMPMTVLEAMAQNRPVICPKVGGVEDFISKNDAMLIKGHDVNALANAISSIYSMTHEQRSCLANAGYQKTKSCYSVENMTRTYEKKYDE